jgi:WD40 repeat protein
MADGRFMGALRPPAPSGEAVSFSGDAGLVAVGAWDSVQVWDVRAGHTLGYQLVVAHGRQKPARRSGPSQTVQAISLAPDGRHVAAMVNDGGASVRVWRVEPAGLLRVQPVDAMVGWSMVHFIPANPEFFVASTSGGLEIRRADNWELVSQVDLDEEDFINDLVFDPTGDYMAVLTARGTIYIISLPDGSVLSTLSDQPTSSHLALFDNGTKLILADSRTLSVLSSADATVLFSADEPPSDEYWDGSIADVVVSPDGSLIAAGDALGVIRLRRASDGALLRVIPAHAASIVSLAFSVDGRYLASGSGDGTLRLWGIWP